MNQNNSSGLLRLDSLSYSTDVSNRLFHSQVGAAAMLDYGAQSHLSSGGDLHDFIPFDSRGVVAAIGHVSGRSAAAAALLIPAMRAFLRTRLPSDEHDLRSVVRDLNHTLCGVSPDSFYATLFAAVLDPGRRELHYVNAGHEPALLVRGGGQRFYRLGSSGTVLGLTTRAGYGMRSITLEPGDVLAAFTDGLVDATDPTGRVFGESGVLQVLRDHPAEQAQNLARRLVDAARRFADRTRPAGDSTAIVVRFNDALTNEILTHEVAEAAMAAA